ncbi:MAG: hypothetical protein IT458_13655 [Planctomycetes bacterium]|nr:hypothetical protein [Planctomycetota bacterium]
MIALLRKDLPWLLAVLAAGWATLAIVLSQEGFVHVWALPATRLGGYFHAAWICGAVLGLCAALADEAQGTRDFLHHRPVSPTRIHAARVLACAVVLAAWWVLPPALHWLIESIFGENAAQARFATLLDMGAVVTAAASAAAIGLFAGTLPCGLVLRFATGAATLLAVFTAIDAFALRPGGEGWRLASQAAFAGWHLAAAFGFGLASFANAGTAPDPDRPLPHRARVVSGTLATLAFAALAATLAGSGQYSGLASLWHAYPAVLRQGDEFVLATRTEDREQMVWERVDRAHQRSPAALDRRGLTFVEDASQPRGTMEPGFNEPRFHDLDWYRPAQRLDVLLCEDGRSWLLRREGYTGRVEVHGTGKGEAGAPFLPGFQALEVRAERERPLWVAEPASGVLWRFAPERGHFVAAQLPGGDRLIAARTVRRDVLDNASRPASRDSTHGQEHLVLQGEQGVYRLDGADLVPAEAWLRALVTVREPQRREFVDADLLSPRLRILDSSGAPLFAHDFAPRTAKERLHAGIACWYSALRPPFLQVAGHLWAARGAQSNPLLDPLVAGGARAWLVLVGIGCAALCAFGAHRRLRRAGVAPAVRRFWVVCIGVCGPAALVGCAAAERARAHAAPPRRSAPAGAPRIATPRDPVAQAPG